VIQLRHSEAWADPRLAFRPGNWEVFDMKWQVAWPDSVSGWCFWASLVTLVGVIGVMMVGAAAGMAREDGLADVLLKVVQFGFAGVVGLFLLGVGCILLRGVRGNGRGSDDYRRDPAGEPIPFDLGRSRGKRRL
jgi:hypothetical protein